MLTRKTGPASAPPPGAESPRRVLAICEDIDGALRMTRHLETLPAGTERQDLSALEAVERLRDSLAPMVDEVLFAPAASEGLRLVAQELVELAAHRARGLTLLLAPGQSHGLVLAPSAEVVVIDPQAAEAAARAQGGIMARLRRLGRGAASLSETSSPAAPTAEPSRPLRLISLQGLSGGAGSTTLAALFAAELAARHPDLKVLLIDLDLQFGQIGAYLDFKDDSRVTDLYSGFGKLDLEAFRACLRPLAPGLQLLAAPPEILPLDALDPRKMPKFLDLARQSADVVVLDLPHAVPDWIDAIWREADLMIWVAEAGLRSSHAFRRLKTLTEGRAFDPRRSEVWLNRLPQRPNREAAETIESLARAFAGVTLVRLPEGGPAISAAQIQGVCPRGAAAASPLVKAIGRELRRFGPRLGGGIGQPGAARRSATE